MTATVDYFDHKGDADLSKAPYHYKRCGLDNIYLVNGFEVDFDEDGERHVTVIDTGGLYRMIGIHLVSNRKCLSGKEIRFLRRTLDLTQANMGRLINQSTQQVARWEKEESRISGPADRLLRLMFLYTLMSDGMDGLKLPMEFLEDLDKLDDVPEQDLSFCNDKGRWLERVTA